jgi:hypothetical protein
MTGSVTAPGFVISRRKTQPQHIASLLATALPARQQ